MIYRFIRKFARPLLVTLFLLLGLALLVPGLISEANTSALQSRVLSKTAETLFFALRTGPSSSIRFPKPGPFTERLGYTDIPNFQRRLTRAGYRTLQQARMSEGLMRAFELGFTPIPDKFAHYGLTIIDPTGRELYGSKIPKRVFYSFEDIAPRIIQILTFIEDRDVLRADAPYHNPAVEWDRLGRAVLDLAQKTIKPGTHVQGGSTLATQIQKFKYSPGGITREPKDKLLQMGSAALMAYRFGSNSLRARQDVVLEYINSVPLAALVGFGEINGLGDGLWSYFSDDLPKVNELLKFTSAELKSDSLEMKNTRARALLHVLALFLAHRRPSDYLHRSPEALKRQISRYLPLLVKEGVVPFEIMELINSIIERDEFKINTRAPAEKAVSFLDRKGANTIRTHLLSLLGIRRLYDLDRIDLRVESTINEAAEKAVTDFFLKLQDLQFVREKNLIAANMLRSENDLSQVVYSFTLYERGEQANLLRVQTDNQNQPLNFSAGVKLDLGSTAKLRTLVTYLEVMSEMYVKLRPLTKEERAELRKSWGSPLSRWALQTLIAQPDLSQEEFLRLAMTRTYSGSPHERFFTAGGLHNFHNFNSKHNGGRYSLWTSLQHSINLPFIRLMRDIVLYHREFDELGNPASLDNLTPEDRALYLTRFVKQEGETFLRKFYKEIRGKSNEELLALALRKARGSKRSLAAYYFAGDYSPSLSGLQLFFEKHFPEQLPSSDTLERYYTLYSERAKSLGDYGYIARLHPLDLWITQKAFTTPGELSWSEALQGSSSACVDSYRWLFETSSQRKQDVRIRQIIEQEAFKRIYKRWKKVGYDQPSLVASYATAIGTSADNPDSLATLMGILLNDGKMMPTGRITRLDFAKGTPFETVFTHNDRELRSEQVLSSAVAAVAKEALFTVVSEGTAVRLRQGLNVGGKSIPVGGKTGTGDHRFKVYSASGALKESRVLNRTANFAFLIGDRYFGVMTVFVPGAQAAKYTFTSSLAVQLVKELEGALSPVFAMDDKLRAAKS